MLIKNLGYHGIFLTDANVILDGTRTNAHAFISHAHADHVPRQQITPVFTTPATAVLMRARGYKGPINELPFGESVTLSNATITLFPAGHILGSAMIFVETDHGSLLYTGDCRTPPSPLTEGFQLPDRAVDYLIIEATFGLPIYKWKSHDVLFRQICHFVEDSIANDVTPVLLCYNMGKAQEVMHALASSDRSTMLQIHSGGVKICRVYEEFGFNLGEWEPYNRSTLADKALIAPGSVKKSAIIQNLQKKRLAYISGWATLESRTSQLLADELIPLSDHLDFFELINVCSKLAPKHTWLNHSPNPDVALHYLRNEGLSCSYLNMHHNDDGKKRS